MEEQEGNTPGTKGPKRQKKNKSKKSVAAHVRQRCDLLLFAFGQKVRTYRITKGMNQKEFAEMVGYSEGSGALPITQIENGRKDLSFLKIMELADAIGYDVELKLIPQKEKPEVILSEGKATPGTEANEQNQKNEPSGE